MKILTNKYFILGNLLLLLVSIPLTLFFIKRQQDLQSSAAPSSKLYFNPAVPNTSTQCSSFNVDIMVDPGQNIVSIVDFYITYDPSKLDILQIKESTTEFPTVVRPPSITSGEANMSVSVGADVTRAVQRISKVATITFRPKAAGSAIVQFDSDKSRVFSLAPADEPTEDVLSTVAPSNVTITTNACPDGSGPSPSVSPSISPSVSPSVTTAPTVSPTIAPTTATNQVPLCSDFSVSPSSTGSAPFSVLFTGKASDPDTSGVITKASFTFGDGQTQDVTDGLNLKDVTVQTNHTYQTAGTYNATLVFTDNSSGVNTACQRAMTVTGSSGSATTTPTPTSSATATTAPTSTPTAAPTIPPTGGLPQTIGIIAAVLLSIIGGFVLLTL